MNFPRIKSLEGWLTKFMLAFIPWLIDFPNMVEGKIWNIYKA